MLKESSETLTGNDRFEGFVVDVIDEVSKLLGFNYILQIVSDNNYGSYNVETGEWNGIIRELLDGVSLLFVTQPNRLMSTSTLLQKADLGIADLSITYEREQAVDFSLPFMNTGTQRQFILFDYFF